MTILNTTKQEDAVVYISDSGGGLTLQITEYLEDTKEYAPLPLTNSDAIVKVTFANKQNITNKTTLDFDIDNHLNGIIKRIISEDDFTTVGKGDYYLQATVTTVSQGKSISTIYDKMIPSVLLVRNKL